VAHTIGIDLGQTNCRTAWSSGPTLAQNIANAAKERKTPTCVAMHADGECLVGSSALALAATHPERAVRDLWTRLVSGEPALLDGKLFDPVTLTAQLLGRLRSDAEARLNERVLGAFVAMPPSWTRDPRKSNRAIPEHVNDAILCALEKNVMRRFQDMIELRDTIVGEPQSLFQTVTSRLQPRRGDASQ
jgi:molecular chaperone DnaK (HSP70)